MLYMYLLLVLQYYHWVLYIVQYFDILFSTEDNVILVQLLHLHRLKANKTTGSSNNLIIDVIQKHHNNTDYLHMGSYLMELVLTLHGIK